MSSFCSLDGGNIGGIFTLTLSRSSIDGHKYLTQDAIADLIEQLTAVRDNGTVKGLVTTCAEGSFCDGIDYTADDIHPREQLAEGVRKVVKLLLELPVPTVAAVCGNATSLGLALALAHDHLVVWNHTALSLPEAKLGRPLPGYVAALLREKVSYARLRKLLMLDSRPCKGSDLPGNPWWLAHSGSDDKTVVLDNARELLWDIVEAEIGADYAVARQTMLPETCDAVDIEHASKCPPARPSDHELQEEEGEEEEEEEEAAASYPGGGKAKRGVPAAGKPSKPRAQPGKGGKIHRKPA